MAALELRSGATFNPGAFAAFLESQRDLGTKWAPQYVRIVEDLPVTATGKIDRTPLRSERWRTSDPIWWRPGRDLVYLPLTSLDIGNIEAAFDSTGRRHLLS